MAKKMKNKNMKTCKILNVVDRIACIIAYPIAVGYIFKVAFCLFGPHSFISMEVSVILGALLFVASVLSSIVLVFVYFYNANESSWKLSITMKTMLHRIFSYDIRAKFISIWKWLSAD